LREGDTLGKRVSELLHKCGRVAAPALRTTVVLVVVVIVVDPRAW
jgi:hypothetical protein